MSTLSELKDRLKVLETERDRVLDSANERETSSKLLAEKCQRLEENCRRLENERDENLQRINRLEADAGNFTGCFYSGHKIQYIVEEKYVSNLCPYLR